MSRVMSSALLAFALHSRQRSGSSKDHLIVYIRFMLADLFEPYNCEVTEARRGITVAYGLVCQEAGIDDTLIWNQYENLEEVLKTSINKLMSVLSNGHTLNRMSNYDRQRLLEFINYHYVKLTPDSKLDNVLEYVSNQSSYEGESIELAFPEPIDLAKMYFANAQEWDFYFRTALYQGLIKRVEKEFPSNQYEKEYLYHLSIEGLTRLIKLSEGKTSNQCFIAMAFVDDMFKILDNAIKPALNKAGFKEYVVNEHHVDSDKTINDAILAGIKKSRFTIADFTHHKGGVYFEAGYALGRGQKVIYTCQEDHMKDAHFDIRNYQHIVWKDADDFQKKLFNKIEAFILY